MFFECLQSKIIADSILVAGQLILVLLIFRKLFTGNNKNCKPIKQYSPYCTAAAALSLFLANIVNFIGRIIEFSLNHTNPYCPLYDSLLLKIMARPYHFFRELAYWLLTIKMFRLCSCYTEYVRRRETNRLPKIFVWVFSKEKNIICFSIVLSSIITAIFAANFITEQDAFLLYEFFCPKRSNLPELVLTACRVVLLTCVYYQSTKVTAQLRLRLILLSSLVVYSSEVVLRTFEIANSMTKFTAHEFYYHSLLTQTGITFIIFLYTHLKVGQLKLKTRSALRFECMVGEDRELLQIYAAHLNAIEPQGEFEQNLNAYLFLSDVYSVEVPLNDCPSIIQELEGILQLNSYLTKNNAREAQQLLKKMKSSKKFSKYNLNSIHRSLEAYCIEKIYNNWVRTKSFHNLLSQYEQNALIDRAMNSLGIDFTEVEKNYVYENLGEDQIN